MNIIKIFFIAFLGLPNFTNAATDGGGGGGFCFAEQKCITLAETGFRVQDNHVVTPVISAELITEVETIIGQLLLDPYMKQYFKSVVFGQPGTFRKVVSYNAKGLAKIRKEYKKLLKSNGIPAEQLVIYAVSNSQFTYFLSEFDQLNLRSQALILIHEGIVRLTGSVLKALKMDGLILDMLDGSSNAAEIISILIKNAPSEYMQTRYMSSYALAAHIYELSLKLNSYMKPEELFLDMTPAYRHGLRDNGIEWTNYCLSAKHEAIFYQKHSSLWSVMNESKIKCIAKSEEFRVERGTLTVQENAKEVCAKMGSGEFLTAIHYIDRANVIKIYEMSPRVLIGIICSESKPVTIYEVMF